MVPSYVHPDDSYTLKNLISDSGDYGLRIDLDGNVIDFDGNVYTDENDNSWSEDRFN